MIHQYVRWHEVENLTMVLIVFGSVNASCQIPLNSFLNVFFSERGEWGLELRELSITSQEMGLTSLETVSL